MVSINIISHVSMYNKCVVIERVQRIHSPPLSPDPSMVFVFLTVQTNCSSQLPVGNAFTVFSIEIE